MASRIRSFNQPIMILRKPRAAPFLLRLEFANRFAIRLGCLFVAGDIEDDFVGGIGAPESTPAALSKKKSVPPKKKDQLALAQYGDKLSSANRPDPDDPGGLGAEESETERTGSTQDNVLATQRGARLAEIGPYYDSANDPVTAYFPSETGFAGDRCGAIFAPADNAPLQRRAVGAIMSPR